MPHADFHHQAVLHSCYRRSNLLLVLLLSLIPSSITNTTMDDYGLNASEKAEASELQRMIAIEQQKAEFQAQVHTFTDVCWDKCVDSPGAKLDTRTETCLVNCVDRFIDTTLAITNRFTQMVQKSAH